MDKKFKKGGKLRAFIKRNAYYLIMAVCIAAIGTMVAVAIASNNKKPTEPVDSTPIDGGGGDEQPVGPGGGEGDGPIIPGGGGGGGGGGDEEIPVVVEIVFASPVAGGTVIKDYCMDSLVFNKTLWQYMVHNGIDYAAADGTAVTAAYGGVVESVTDDLINGKMVIINHGNGVRTVYASLGSTSVENGQTVTTGQALGTVGTTSSNELLDGPHVHFMATRDGKIISPYEYLPDGNK